MIYRNVPELKVSDEEIQQFFENNKAQLNTPEMTRASHILLNSSVKAQQVITQVKSGADFAQMAAEHSIGPSAQVGGDLDFFSRGMLLPEFEGAAFNLSVGDVSDIVQTDAGYHIIKITDRKPAKEATLQEVKPIIRLNLFDAKLRSNQGKVGDYINTLINQADVQRFERK